MALLLRRVLGHRQATVTIVDAHFSMTYQPLPAEAAAGSVEPCHVGAGAGPGLPGSADLRPGRERHPRYV